MSRAVCEQISDTGIAAVSLYSNAKHVLPSTHGGAHATWLA